VANVAPVFDLLMSFTASPAAESTRSRVSWYSSSPRVPEVLIRRGILGEGERERETLPPPVPARGERRRRRGGREGRGARALLGGIALAVGLWLAFHFASVSAPKRD